MFWKHFGWIVLWFVSQFFMNGDAMAQVVPGVLDNYSGSTSAWLNPSNISTTFVHDDLGLLSVGFSVDNNFAYLPRRTFWPSLIDSLAMNGIWARFEGVQQGKTYYYQYPDDDSPRNAYQSFDVALPSLMVTFAGNHAIAFSMRTRAYTSAMKMPWEIPVLITESLDYDVIQNVPFSSEGMCLSTMEWVEADVSYATTAIDMGDLKLDVGATGKFLMAMSGASLKIDQLEYSVLDNERLSFRHLDAVARLALPLSTTALFSDLDSFIRLTDPLFRGYGFGGDVGLSLTYKRNSMVRPTQRSACDDAPVAYWWRLGASLLDVGMARFNNNAIQGRLTGSDFLVNITNFDTVTRISGALALLDSVVGNTEPAFAAGAPFFMGMPTAMSVQFDANVYGDFYCNATWVQPLSKLFYRSFYHSAVEREPLLSVTPRYETSFFGVSIPVTLYNYSYLTAGALGGGGALAGGGKDFVSLTGLGKTRSIDFMVAVRLKLDRGDCLFDPLYDACGTRYRRRK